MEQNYKYSKEDLIAIINEAPPEHKSEILKGMDYYEVARYEYESSGSTRNLRGTSSRIDKAANKVQSENAKKRIPQDVAKGVAYAILDRNLSEKDLMKATLAAWNNGREDADKFTEAMFKDVRHSNMSMGKVIDYIEEHPLVETLKEYNVWHINRNISRWGQLMKAINTSLKGWDKFTQMEKKLNEKNKKILEESTRRLQLEVECGYITEAERKTEIVGVCRGCGLTLQETSDYTGIPLSTVKKKSLEINN